MQRVVLTFGFLAGAILSVLMLATLRFMDFDSLSMLVGYTTMVVAFLMIFFGIRSYRDNVGNGEVSFGRAFKVGILIAAIGSACYVVTWQVISHTLMPDFAEKYSAHVIDKQRASGASEAKIAATTAEMQNFTEMYKNPLYVIPMTFLEVFPPGLIITLLSAAILRRRHAPALASERTTATF